MRVETGAGLNEVLLEDAEGAPVGLLLGFPIDLDGAKRLTRGIHRLSFAVGGDVDAFANRVIDSLAGRFQYLCTAGGSARIYLDCIGQVPCVYDIRTGIAGTSAHAVLSPEEYDARLDKALFDRLEIAVRGWIPGGLTAHEDLLRLLPNHVLDLDTLSVTRHWPPAQISVHDDPQAAVEKLIEIVRVQMKALHDTGKQVAQGLTAGYETRMLLGCARPFLENTTFITVVGEDVYQKDTVIARRIAEREGLTYRALPRSEASPEAQALYLRRNGHCLVDSNGRFFPSTEPISQSHILIGGAAGEIGCAMIWRSTDRAEDIFDGARLGPRLGLPYEPRLIEALDRWIANLPPGDAFGLMDLVHVEHRWGPWFGAQFASDPTMERYAPLATRRTVELMLGLPHEWKQNRRYIVEVVRATWPELLSYPFNSLGRFRDLWLKAGRAIREPSVILRTLRKRLG